MDLNRREFLTHSLGIMALLFTTQAAASNEVISLFKNLPEPPEINSKPSFSAFLVLSKFLTATEDLDEEFAKEIYMTFMQEPWVGKHVNSVIAVIREQLEKKILFDVHSAVSSGFFEENETWFIGHLVFTWFSGLYYYTGKDKRLAFENTLSHQVLRDIYPTPTFSAGMENSFWALKPVEPAL